MRIYARHGRPLVVGIGLGLSLLGFAGGGTSARAEFFFPFFDNRPSTPPRVEPPRPHRRRSEGGSIDLRQKSRPHHGKPRAKDTAPKPAQSPNTPENVAAPVEEGPPPPYEPQLLRLSEILGALSYLQSICVDSTAAAAKAQEQDQLWRERMQNLMSAEAAGPARREKLAGAYNRGMQGYQYSYRVCTPSARLARQRFLDEGGWLAHDITTQYRAN